MKRNLLAILLLLPCQVGCGTSEQKLMETSHSKYKPGQVWQYKTRPAEQRSRAVVLRIDHSPSTGFIVHLALYDVAIKSPSSPDGVAREIAHLPFSEAAVDKSVTVLDGVGSVPDFRDGYGTWRAAFDQHRAGFWSTSLAEAVDAMEAAVNQR
ncbi:MAG: hypothetical protein R3B70_10720 [Polyangiaceae bacterium]